MKNIELSSLFDKIAGVIESLRKQVRQHVNNVLLITYWQIGKIIIEDELKGNYRADYGKEVLKFLSERLTSDFGRGFDITNLRKMKRFYALYQKQDAVRLELSWTHYRLICTCVTRPSWSEFCVSRASSSGFCANHRSPVTNHE